MVRLEEMTDQQLCALTGDFEKLRARLVATGQGPRTRSESRSDSLKPEASGEAE